MIEGKATLVVDLGNSETRVLAQYGRTTKGKVRQRLASVSNQFADLPEGYEIPETYTSEDSVVFSSGGINYANGFIVEREFAVQALRPTALEKKYQTLTTTLAFQRALLEGYKLVADIMKVSTSEVEVSWDVVVMLPPADLKQGAAKLAETLKSIKTLDVIMPEFNREVKIDSVKVLPEGFSAFVGTLFTKGADIRDGYAYLADSSVLVIDIGAGTTDFCVIKGSSVIEETKDSVEIGGNNIHQRVRKELKLQGLSLPDSEVRASVVSGTLKDGAKTLDIKEVIESAKTAVANSIVSTIKDYFEASQFPIRTIEYLLVVGGGTLKGTDPEIRPISEHLVSYLKKLSANIELVGLPTDAVETDTGEVVNSEVSPRHLNILGAAVLGGLKNL